MSSTESERTLHCECGSEEYNIKWEAEPNGRAWAVCADCGRPTSVLGAGKEKQRQWLQEHE